MKKLSILVLLFSAINGIAQSSLYTKDTLAVNQVFRQRVKSATIIAANQIAASTTDSVWNYSYANEVIKNPDGGWISSITYQVVANPAISYESSDGDIQFTVNANFEKVAKAWLGYITPVDNSGQSKLNLIAPEGAVFSTMLNPIGIFNLKD